MTRYYHYDDLRDLFVGKSVVKAEMESGYSPRGLLTLSDGTTLRVGGNEGGCICGAGDYDLTELNTVDNIITNVQVIEPPGEYERGGCYQIFVFADNRPINLATFEGDDGNGYYGTGFWLEVLE